MCTYISVLLYVYFYMCTSIYVLLQVYFYKFTSICVLLWVYWHSEPDVYNKLLTLLIYKSFILSTLINHLNTSNTLRHGWRCVAAKYVTVDLPQKEHVFTELWIDLLTNLDGEFPRYLYSNDMVIVVTIPVFKGLSLL